MADSRIRRRITLEAARLMYEGQVSEYYVAKRKAARRMGVDPKPQDLPSNAEIRHEILGMASLFEGADREDRLCEMRLRALSLMRALRRFDPRLIGSTLTGHIRSGSDIDLHVFAASAESVCLVLDDLRMLYEVERKRVVKFNEERIFVHIHVLERYPIELTVYAPDKRGYGLKSSITGKTMERANLEQLEELMEREYPDLDLEAKLGEQESPFDDLDLYRGLLAALQEVKQRPDYHPEGDALFHSLQVFDLARKENPWDFDFLLAALLHDVGKAFDPSHHVEAGLLALEGAISKKTASLIAHHMDAQKILDGTLGHKKRVQLRHSEWYEELMQLARCDREGRVPGAAAPTLEEALEEVATLALELERWA